MFASSYSLAVASYSMLFICLQSLHVMAIPTISAVGSKFFTSNGDQFYIKGVAYQLVPHDPLIDTEQCKLDASLMKELGANTIRVYHVDADGDHKGCMSAFADAGIYLFVDLDDFDTQIEQTSPHWNNNQFEAFKKVLDEFQQYDNTAGVFVGNEVLTTEQGSPAAPYVLAAARDIKEYRDSKGYRKIPVGYSAADIAQLRPMLQNYMACSSNTSERLDFFSLNAYEWCGDSSYTTSGYSELQKNATDYPIPIFFSETGCNTPKPRTFQDQAAIFGSEMSGTWSGSIIYEWIEEANDYGLINYGPPNPNAGSNSIVQDGYTRKGTPTPISPDFNNLKSQWATLNPTGVALSEYSASAAKITAPPCPASTSGGWEVNPSSPLPTLGQTLGKEGTKPTNTASASGTGASSTDSAASSTSSAKSGAASRATVAGLNHADGLGSIVMLLCGLVGVVSFLL